MLFGIKRYVTGAIFLELEEESIKSRVNEKFFEDSMGFEIEITSVNLEISNYQKEKDKMYEY